MKQHVIAVTTLIALSACDLNIKIDDSEGEDLLSDSADYHEETEEEEGDELEDSEDSFEDEEEESLFEDEEEEDNESEDSEDSFEEEGNDEEEDNQQGSEDEDVTNGVLVPTVEWHIGQGTEGEEHVHEGMQTSDGGYIAIGQNQESGSSKTDILIVKVDAAGQLQWQKSIGSAGQWDVGIAIVEVADGYIAGGGIAVGNTQKAGLLKLDLSGNMEWQETFAHSGVGMIRGLDVMSNGNLVVTGFVSGVESGFVFISDESEGFLSVVDLQGNPLWQKNFSDIPQGTKVRQTLDGGFVVLSTAWVESNGQDAMNATLIKTDATGNVEWKEFYGGGENNQAFDFDLTVDGSFILAGHTTGYGADNWDCLLTKVDSSGNLEWVKRFGQPRGYNSLYIHDECYGVRQDHDGGFVMTGGSGNETGSYSESGHPTGVADEWKSYLIKVDASGNLLWEQVYGDGAGNGNNAAEFLSLTDDGGYMLFNDTDSTGEMQPNNYGFMKLSAVQ